MHQCQRIRVVSLEERAKDEQKPFLEQLLQEGARKLLQAAIENEVTEYIQFHKDRRDENGQRLVVRNGHLPERELVSGVGPIPVRQPRVRHRDEGRFTSAILPKYMRRAPSIDALLPALYLKGISTGDFLEALTAILGDRASGLSASNIVSLKSGWETDYKVWSQRDLSAKRYVYWWADGVKGKFRSFLLASTAELPVERGGACALREARRESGNPAIRRIRLPLP
jgi:putative transposase